jgi:hypothetical protein
MGVHKTQRPHLTNKGKGVHKSSRAGEIRQWFAALSERLRRVRVVCGDWSRVCGGDWQASHWQNVGIFFDPPYGHAADRDERCYHTDSLDVADKVREWCLERGGRADHRIVLAGYFDEHKTLLLEHGWTVKKWSAGGGYARQGDGKGAANRHKEALFFSPHCLDFALFS